MVQWKIILHLLIWDMNVLIAGGSGLLGRHLERFLTGKGHQVSVLSRRATGSQIQWNPDLKEIDIETIKDTEVLINLCGAGIADKRWTKDRMQQLIDSRIVPAQFLHEISGELPDLKQYIGASGISCYGFDEKDEAFKESDAYGNDFTSRLVKQWEEASSLFEGLCTTSIIRTAVVLAANGGAIEKLSKPIKLGLGASLGPGDQQMQWIHIDDYTQLIEHVMTNQLSGTFNALAGNCSNKELTVGLAQALGKNVYLPNIPSFVVRLMFGKMSELLLKGVPVCNEKITNQEFEFKYLDLNTALQQVVR
jgi:uncharacterized protein (TIGR01777 family)